MATDLKDIRETVKADQESWDEIQREGDTDLLCVAGRIWEAMDPDGLRLRQDRHRPALSLDELGQYTNQLINEVRANKRAIRVTPIGYGANDKTAQYRQDRIRQIEYRSNAQSAYTCMFENAVQRSYGYLRINAKFVNDSPDPNNLQDADFDQELLIQPIVNPNTVVPDAASVMPDGSDMQHLTVTETLRKAEFEKKYPDAQPVNFSDGPALAPGWIKGESVTIGEHWRIETTKKTLLLVETIGPDGVPATVPMFSADYAKAKKHIGGTVKRERDVTTPKVVQYLTNGLEILDAVDWPGKYLPFVQCLGKVLYLTDGGVTKRVILSLPRLARHPAMLYCYIRTCEAEAIGGVPRATFVGYEGQFQGHESEWQKANHEPVAYLEVKPTTEGTGGQVLPPPQRQSWDPPLHNLEISAEAARRAIQAAIGSMPLPTQAQRQNEKSGVALQKIQDSRQQGQFHFIDHYEDALARTGVILEDLIPHYDDTARDVTVRQPDNEASMVRINDPTNPESVPVSQDGKSVGMHDVTISTGPSKDSEREASTEFASGLIGNQQLPMIIGPQKMAKVIALGIKLLDVGPVGDEIANIIDPPPEENPQGQANPQQAQMQMQQAQQAAQQAIGQMQAMGQELQQLKQGQQVDLAKLQAQMQIEQAKGEREILLQKMKDATTIAVAQINAQAKGAIAATEAENEMIALQQTHQHEAGMSAQQMAAQQSQQQAQAQTQQAMQQQQQAHEMTSAEAQAEREAQAQQVQPETPDAEA